VKEFHSGCVSIRCVLAWMPTLIQFLLNLIFYLYIFYIFMMGDIEIEFLHVLSQRWAI